MQNPQEVTNTIEANKQVQQWQDARSTGTVNIHNLGSGLGLLDRTQHMEIE